MLKEFLELAKQYRELILLVASLIGAFFFVMDYFATKQEVQVLKCQADNSIALIGSRINVEQITKNVISLTKTKEEKKSDQLETTSLSLEIDKLKNELNNEYDTQRRAADNLKPDACEKAVKKS